MSAELSTSVPASPGVKPSGGAYCGAMGRSRGSRPRVYHSQNITTNTPAEMENGQLLRKNSATFAAAPGSLTKPLSQPTTTVRPSRKESARRMRNSTALPAT